MTMITFRCDIVNAAAAIPGTSLPLALTPWERWSAAGQMNSNANVDQLVTLISVVVLIVLVALLIRTSFNRIQQERQRAHQQFLDDVRRRTLSVREYHILLDIISQSGLRRKEAIFGNNEAFELGVSRMLEDAAD